MSKKPELLEEFIKLRIKGKSFADIEKLINVNKSTLIEWNKEALTRNAIKDGRAIFYNELIKTFEYDRKNRIEALLKLSKRINEELEKRDLKDIATEKLITLAIKNEGRLEGLLEETEIGANPRFHPSGTFEDGYFPLHPTD